MILLQEYAASTKYSKTPSVMVTRLSDNDNDMNVTLPVIIAQYN